ncbi:MAG: AAA family ATPase [Deltaproteobacteria bacterium]|nr:AAA family ATPase [Deltaproteobacteria bacterium]
MYTSYFGFKENPFNLTPDPRYLFLSTHHREALDHILYGVNERKGFIVITGGIGTGKTTLCRAFLSQLESSIKSALIFNSFITEQELLETLIEEFGIGPSSAAGTKKKCIDTINEFLLQNFSQGGNAVLVIDEAQNLSPSVLEQIRMLSNLETEKEKLIQIVLVGQPELKDLLTSSSMQQLNERIVVRFELRTLDHKDVRGYVEHRLVVGGGKGDLRFKNSAFDAIYKYSRGNPRRINAVCDRALLIAYVNEKRTISRAIVAKAIDDIRGDLTLKNQVQDWSLRRAISPTVLVLLLIMVAGFAGWNFTDDLLQFFSGKTKSTPANAIDVPSKAPVPKKKTAAPLFLDEKSSLAGLFDLYYARVREGSDAYGDGHLGLVRFTMEPNYCVMFKKPFRVHVAVSPTASLASPRYLLIREISEAGAIAIDTKGKERHVNNDFLLDNWGNRVSWIYPFKNNCPELMKGMSGPDVLEIQRMLIEIGYQVDTTGIFDEATFLEVIRFQKRCGLMSDGIVGRRTKALLYQMTK